MFPGLLVAILCGYGASKMLPPPLLPLVCALLRLCVPLHASSTVASVEIVDGDHLWLRCCCLCVRVHMCTCNFRHV